VHQTFATDGLSTGSVKSYFTVCAQWLLEQKMKD